MMPARIPLTEFAHSARAQTNLALIEGRLPSRLWSALSTLLAQVPDPDASLNYLERFTAEADRGTMQFLAHMPEALDSLLVLFSYSNFLSETLVSHPELIRWLHAPARRAGIRRPGADASGGLEHSATREELDEEFARYAASHTEVSLPLLLARFKRRQYLRITLRDVLGLATLTETTLELSHLADALLEAAVRGIEPSFQKQWGRPHYVDSAGQDREARLTILSLGKLGGVELNYSSDIDLMFLFTEEGETRGGARSIANSEYFVRLAQEVLKTIASATREGAVFRVDLRLRPQGAEGNLAISFPAAHDYYLHRARPWELQMLIKARASTGDAAAARAFLRALAPRIFPPAGEAPTPEQFAAIEAVLYARREITRQLRRRRHPGALLREHSAEWNVKLSPGGIRDIEFLTQCLQRLHGSSDAWLSGPATASTLVALQRLHDKGHLSAHDFSRLADAYQFLRKVEHRLQLRDGLQRHALPGDAAALDRLARRCGITPEEAAQSPVSEHPGDNLKARIARHFAEVRELYDQTVRPSRAQAPSAADPGAAARPTTDAALAAQLQILYPAVARAAQSAPDAFARRGWQRFLSAAVLDPAILRDLETHAEWIPRCLELFSRSDLAVEWLARDPAEIRVLSDPGLVGLRGSLASLAHPAATLDDRMSALRMAYRRSVLATVVRALTGRSAPFDTFRELTRLAEESICAALAAAVADIPGTGESGSAPFSVLALGRLGTVEMDIASDADLVFILDDQASSDPACAATWRRVAERLVQIVSSHTRDGILFPVDTRLRPRGSEGELLQTSSSLAVYFESQAQSWEAAAWIKARCIAGNPMLGQITLKRLREIFPRRWSGDGYAALRADLAALRTRMEREGTGPQARTEFKHLAGGFYDIEYILAALYFRCLSPAARAQDWFEGNVLQQIASLEGAGGLSLAQAESLRGASTLFRGLDHAHRLVTGRAANRPPEPALLERIAPLLSLWKISTPGGLDPALESARCECRSLYKSVLLEA